MGITAGLAVVAAIAGLIVLPLAQPNLKLTGIWDAICSAAGIPYVSKQADVIQPETKMSAVVVTSRMLAKSGSSFDWARRHLGAEVRHLPRAAGVSRADSPNLAGQYAAVIYKELNDFKAGRSRECRHEPVRRRT